MNRTKYLMKNTAIFALGKLGTNVINFLMIPLYTKCFTTEQYGTVDLIFTICSIGIPILMLNINEAVMRFALDKNAEQNKIMSIGILAILLSAISGFLLYGLSGLYYLVAEYRMYIYLYSLSYCACEILICYLRGKELLVAYSMGNIVRTFSIAVFNIIFLLFFKSGIQGYLMAFILANMITAIYAFVKGNVIDVIFHFRIDRKLFKEMIRYSIPLIPTSFTWWIVSSSDRIMLTSMVGVGASGIYAVSAKIPSLISTFSTIFNQAFSYSAIHEKESRDRLEFYNKTFDCLLSVVTIIGLGVLLVIKLLMKYYVADDFYIAWRYTPPLIVGTCFMVLGTFFSVSYTVHKDSIGFLKSGVAAAMVNVVLNLILIPILKTWGAAFATCMSYVVVFFYRYYDIRKYIRLDVFNKKHFASSFMLIISGITIYFNIYFHSVICVCMLISTLFIYRSNWSKCIKTLLRR